MGKESSDIDIALDDMYGAKFAEYINKELYGNTVKFGVISQNNEKSKHLETATIKVHGVMIDLVNLRSESYSDHSRVPDIDIGTPSEDAFRRDLTINSLFYNINNKEVEDFTNMGLKDLEEKIIRTPLEPLQTYMDDPLRILRTIRFATRFQFKIDESIFKAVSDENVRV
jgi:tRNA nucleotidyltransferase (CCA-adding enzyme)